MISLGFVFSAIAEFAVLLFIKQRRDSKDLSMSIDMNGTNLNDISSSRMAGPQKDKAQESSKKKIISRRKKPGEILHRNGRKKGLYELCTLPIYNRIDLFALFLFNIGYLFFNCIYWMY